MITLETIILTLKKSDTKEKEENLSQFTWKKFTVQGKIESFVIHFHLYVKLGLRILERRYRQQLQRT